MIEKAIHEDSNRGPNEDSIDQIFSMRQSTNGLYRVLCIDKFDYSSCVVAEFTTAKEALSYAREKTREAMDWASDSSIATVYYAYDPKGRYLGGDSWRGE